MKLSIATAILILFGIGNMQAQSLSYKLVLDDPEPQPWICVNVDLAHLDMNANLDSWSFNIGAWGFVEPNSKLGANFNLKKSWLALGKLADADAPGHLEFNVGGHLWLNSKTKTKDTKIVLSRVVKGESTTTNTNGDRVTTRSELETFFTMPAKRHTMTGVRAGIYYKQSPFGMDDAYKEPESIASPYDMVGLSSFGLWGGLVKRSKKNLFVEVEGHGTCYNSVGDDFYADLLVLPGAVIRDTDSGELINDQVKGQLKNALPVGFRLGWMRYQIEQRSRTGKRFGMSANFETGWKPYYGFFLSGGLGLTVVKAKR